MKKFSVAALAAMLVVSLAAIAYAQYTPPTHTMTAKVTPTSAGTSKKPRQSTLRVGIKTPATSNNTVSNFTFRFPKGLKVSPKGFPVCTVSTIVAAGNVTNKCPGKSKVGAGDALAYLGSRNGPKIELAVTVFAGGPSSFTIYVAGKKAPFTAIKRAFPGSLKSDTGDFAQQLSTDIPKDVQFQGQTPVVLDSVAIRLGGNYKKGRRKFLLVTNTGCTTSTQYLLGSKLSYSVPAGATSTAKATSRCKGKRATK